MREFWDIGAWTLGAVLLAVCALATGCATGTSAGKDGADRAREAPSPPPPGEDREPFFMRQTIYADARGREKQIDAVVEYTDGVVTTVFLNPIGKAGVILRQTGREVDVSGPAVDKIPFDLRWVAHDIGFALLVTPLEVPGRQGDQTRSLETGEVVESWARGRLLERESASLATTVVYEWRGEGRCPETIYIENGEFGYELRIETVRCRTE